MNTKKERKMTFNLIYNKLDGTRVRINFPTLVRAEAALEKARSKYPDHAFEEQFEEVGELDCDTETHDPYDEPTSFQEMVERELNGTLPNGYPIRF